MYEGTIVELLTKDLKKLAGEMTRDQARIMVQAYYQMQKDRMRYASRVRAFKAEGQSTEVFDYMLSQSSRLETVVSTMLTQFAKNHPVSDWLLAQKGIGPIFTAGLLSMLDITKSPTAGHFWSYAGLDPDVVWEKGQKRPWNADLKKLCWLIGESFMKVSSREGAQYGQLYLERKAYEWDKNLNGEYAAYADHMLETRNFSNDTDARKWYTGLYSGITRTGVKTKPAEDHELEEHTDEALDEERIGQIKGVEVFDKKGNHLGKPGIKMLPPAHIHERAKRYAVKIFLSHLHKVMYEERYKTPTPAPYAIAILGHAHFIEPTYPEKKTKRRA